MRAFILLCRTARRLCPGRARLPALARKLPIWLLILAACGSSDPAGDAGSAAVEIGTGTLDFEPLQDEQPLDLIAGPQGGYHFIVHARIRGMQPGNPLRLNDPGNPVTRFRVLDQAGAQVDIPEVRQIGYEDAGNGWYDLPSGRIVRVLNTRVPDLYGTRVRLQVLVEDAAGNVAMDEAWITAVEYLPVDASVPDAPADASADAAAPDAPPAPDAGLF